MVFSRPTFRKNSISIYCIALAIFDSHIIYDAVIYFITLLYNYLVITYSNVACISISYITYGFNSILTWILIAFSNSKVFKTPILSNGMKRPIIHYIIILSIVLFNLLLSRSTWDKSILIYSAWSWLYATRRLYGSVKPLIYSLLFKAVYYRLWF
jgi:hypothetical protein